MRFVSVLLAVIVMAVVSGCGKQPGQYGNFANAQSGGLAGDSVAVLKTAYPPAKTRLNLLHQYSDDAFGVELVEALRREGYAIAEYVPPPRGDKYSTASPESSPNTMDIKTGRARRINNKPVLIACMVIVVVILTFVQVLIGRRNRRMRRWVIGCANRIERNSDGGQRGKQESPLPGIVAEHDGHQNESTTSRCLSLSW